MVEHATRGADDDVHTALQRLQLAEDRLPAVHRHDLDTEVPAVLEDRLGHLHRQLAGRHEHEGGGRRASTADIERVKQRQGERRSLAGAGRRLTDEIASLDEMGDRLPLHRSRLLVAEFGQRVEQLAAQPEGGEAVLFIER